MKTLKPKRFLFTLISLNDYVSVLINRIGLKFDPKLLVVANNQRIEDAESGYLCGLLRGEVLAVQTVAIVTGMSKLILLRYLYKNVLLVVRSLLFQFRSRIVGIIVDFERKNALFYFFFEAYFGQN